MRKKHYLCIRFSSEAARLRISPCEMNRLALLLADKYIAMFLSVLDEKLESRSSAVGSAPRSGRGGWAFESPLLDIR